MLARPIRHPPGSKLDNSRTAQLVTFQMKSRMQSRAPLVSTRRTRISRGVGLALVAAVLFGASAPFAKLLLRGAAPQLLAGLLYLGSGVGLTLVWLRLRRRGR